MSVSSDKEMAAVRHRALGGRPGPQRAGFLRYVFPGLWLIYLGQSVGGVHKHSHGTAAAGNHWPQEELLRLHDEVRDLALRERPKVIFCGGTALPRTVDFPAFAEIAAEVDAVLVADIAHIAGLVAGGAHPSPVGFAPVKPAEFILIQIQQLAGQSGGSGDTGR